MEKKILEFRPEEGEGLPAYLRVMVVAITPEEQIEVRSELNAFGFKFDYIEADAARATLYAAGDRGVKYLMEVMEKLKASGWEF